MKKNILITGLPRSGKSTILKKIISKIQKKVGFITNEMRENSERTGFEIETYSGKKSILASTNFKTKLKVSRYSVEINNLDSLIPELINFSEEDILYIDEIGQMELYSDNFKKLVLKYLDSSNICIATISKVYNDKFIEQIKNRKDIILIEITEENRDLKERDIDNLIKRLMR